MILEDQIALAINFREFRDDIQGYAETHEYATIEQAAINYRIGETLNKHKFAGFTTRELKLISDSI